MKNALVYMTFLFLLTGMLAGCTENEAVETDMDSEENIEMEVEVDPSADNLDVEVTVDEGEDVDMEVEVKEDSESTVEENTESSDANLTVYADGTYTQVGSYNSPAGPESVNVSITLAGDVITGVSVTPLAENTTSLKFQQQFAGGIASVASGVRLEDLNGVSAVSGASLTSKGFNSALASIKASAQN